MKIKNLFTKRLAIAMCVLVVAQSALAFYNPSTGRWLSRDPIAENGGLNSYALVRNQPTQKQDYLGLLELKHIGPGFQYVKGPPEFFWLGLQARLTEHEAIALTGERGILLSKAQIYVRISDCCGASKEREGTMYYLDRFFHSGGELAKKRPGWVETMSDRRNSLVFQPIHISSSQFDGAGRRTPKYFDHGTEGEIFLVWEYKLQPFNENLWSGNQFYQDDRYDWLFHPEADHKPWRSVPPYEWGYYTISQGSYVMSFKWNNCSGGSPSFGATPSLEPGPQRLDHEPAPGAVFYR